MGDHLIKVGFEREEVDVNNLFAQNSEGSYVFDSLDDLRNATASGLLYNNAVTNNENDLRAICTDQFILYPNTWDVSSDLTLDFVSDTTATAATARFVKTELRRSVWLLKRQRC